MLTGGDLGIISKLLCVVSDSFHDELAFEFVAHVAKQNRSEVVILNVAKKDARQKLGKKKYQ